MFEVYLNDRRDLLVIEKGNPLPLFATTGKWRKRKKKVARVSDEIGFAVRTQGYYVRKRGEHKNHGSVRGELPHSLSHVQSLTASPLSKPRSSPYSV